MTAVGRHNHTTKQANQPFQCIVAPLRASASTCCGALIAILRMRPHQHFLLQQPLRAVVAGKLGGWMILNNNLISQCGDMGMRRSYTWQYARANIGAGIAVFPLFSARHADI
jgi:hypothetical protein